jgi:hypothetical protein
MAVKIHQPLIIMKYIANISNNCAQGDGAYVYTAGLVVVLLVDLISATMLHSCSICYYSLIISKKRVNAYGNSKGGG